MREQRLRVPSSLPGVSSDVQLENLGRGRFKVDVQTTTAISQSFLDARAAEQQQALANNHGRAPMGDAHGAWQKVAEIPLALLMQHCRGSLAELAEKGFSFADQKALKRLINDPDLKKLRSDVPERTY